MEYFVISAKFVPLKYYTLSSQLQRLTSFSVGCSGRRILSPGQIAVMRKWSIVYIFPSNMGELRILQTLNIVYIRDYHAYIFSPTIPFSCTCCFGSICVFYFLPVILCQFVINHSAFVGFKIRWLWQSQIAPWL